MPLSIPRRAPGVTPTAPLPNFRHSADEFISGAPLPDLGPFNREIQAFAEKEQQKANQVAILDADNQLSDAAIQLQSEALNRQGKDALDALPKAADQWKSKTSDIEQSLTNDDQKLAFRRLSIGRWDNLHETIARHTDAEMQKYDASTTDAAVQNRLNDALTHYTDPNAIGSAVAETKALLTDFGKRHGISSDVLQQQTAAAVSKVHVGVIDRMLANGQDLAASKYYQTAKPEIAGTDTPQLEKSLEEGSVRGESQRQADAIVAKHPDRKSALEQARALSDAKVREATVEQINQRFNEQDVERRETSEHNMITATNIVDQSGTIYKIPPSLWTSFSLNERASLKEYAKQKAKGDPIETNWTTYYDLLSRASSDATKDGFLRDNLLRYRSQLGDTEFKQVAELQAGLRRGDEKADTQLVGIRTRDKILNSSLNAAGIDPTPKPGSDDADRVSDFGRAVDEQGILFEQEHKRKPNAKELQSIVDNLMVQGSIAGTGILGFFQTKKREFQRMPGEGDFVVDISSVPRADRAKIEDALRRAKQPVTDANILRLYQQKLSQMVPLASQ